VADEQLPALDAGLNHHRASFLSVVVVHRCDQWSREPLAWKSSSGFFAVLLRCHSCGHVEIDSGREPVAGFKHVTNRMVLLHERLRHDVLLVAVRRGPKLPAGSCGHGFLVLVARVVEDGCVANAYGCPCGHFWRTAMLPREAKLRRRIEQLVGRQIPYEHPRRIPESVDV
jgi:hypothetical protein